MYEGIALATLFIVIVSMAVITTYGLSILRNDRRERNEAIRDYWRTGDGNWLSH